MKRLLGLLVGSICLVATFAAYAAFTVEWRSRREPEAFASKYAFGARHPDLTNSLAYAPSADFATDMLADVAIRDSVEPVNVKNLPPATRTAWIDVITRFDEQMRDVTGLSLNAIEQRPGWPYHAFFVGEAVYARSARAFSPDLIRRREQWIKPLLHGIRSAESDTTLSQSLASAYLQTWSDLGALAEADVAPIFRRAFDDPEFVRDTFGIAVQTLGTTRAMRYLPDRAKSLWSAFEQLGRAGGTVAAWQVHQRWDAAEWREREADLREIENCAARNDTYQVLHLCQTWMSQHSIYEYDSDAAHRQAGRLLRVWPHVESAGWNGDPRAELLRYLLSGRAQDVDATALARAAESIQDVPLPVSAQIHVLAADMADAESLSRSSDSFGSFEWTPYLVELAKHWSGTDKSRARAALDQVSPAARNECNVRIVAAVVGYPGATSPSITQLSDIGDDHASVVACAPTPSSRSLHVYLRAGAPAIFDCRLDGARTGTIFLRDVGSAAAVRVVLPAGLRTVSVQKLGGSSMPSSVELVLEP